MNNIFDIIIVGAGPAGAFLAYKLSKIGLRILVLEKNITPKRKVCGEYLCPLGVELLRREGLEREIIGEFLPLSGMLIVTASDTRVNTSFPFQEKYHGVSVNRQIFDENIITLAKRSGAEFKTGVEVRKITQQSDRWIVETNQGSFITNVVVGADGRGSVVSKAFQNDIPNTGKRVALHVLVHNKDKNLRRGEMHIFDNGAYIGVNPTGEKEVNFSLVLDAEDLRKLGSPFEALNYYLEKSPNLKSRFPRFLEEDKISTAFPIQHQTRSIIPCRNVVLIGDAAGFVDPLTGEGMYNAMLSASLLAKEIIRDSEKSLKITKQVFTNYQKQYSKVLRQKILLNRLFQLLIRRPRLVELVASYLLKKQARADIFIGIIGNIYSPIKGILKLILNLRSAQ
ncbi:MAG: NAD(P)/FAD-dependent oxidoreductase [Bdellovibrionota bacterium]